MTSPTTVQVRLQLRADTAANWTSTNPVLLSSEMGRETDTGKIKIGDGSTAWSSLAYQAWATLPVAVSAGGTGQTSYTNGQLLIGNTTGNTLTKTTLTAGSGIGVTNGTGSITIAASGIADTNISATAEIAVSKLADGAARQLLQTAANGTDVEWTNNVDVPGTLDVTGAATFDAAVTIQGDLTVNGTTTTIDTNNLVVEDKNVIIGNVTTPTDVTADGGGITLKGTTDKTINWVDSTDAWTLSEHVSIASGKEYRINGTKVLDATSLGTAVVGSSLTSVGTIGTGTWQGTTVATGYGGTGQTTYSNGQLLIGKTDGTLAKATLTASTGVTITNADGSITISATGSGGTVTAVTGTSPIASTGGATPVISIAAATTSVAGAVQLSDSTSTTSSVLAATPTAVKGAFDLADAALPKAGGTLTGDVTLNAQADLRFGDADSSNYIALQAPATVSANVTFTLPAADGTAAQVLSTNGSGTLSFVTVGLSDGDKGDITISGSGATFTIDNDAVTYAKIQDVSATDRLLGRSTAGAGNVEEITCTTAGRALIDDADAAAQRTTLGLGTIATQTASAVSITGGTVTGITDLTVADGGTGASTLTANGILFGNGTSAVGVTAVGTATHVLTSNGAGVAPTFQAASAGALTLLSTVTITSNTATADIETTIDSTYDSYLIVVTGLRPSISTERFRLRLKLNGAYQTTTYKSNYSVTSSNNYVGEVGPTDAVQLSGVFWTDADSTASYNIYVRRTTSTTTANVVNWNGVMASDSLYNNVGVGSCNVDGALTGVRLFMSGAANISTGVFRLYGIAN